MSSIRWSQVILYSECFLFSVFGAILERIIFRQVPKEASRSKTLRGLSKSLLLLGYLFTLFSICTVSLCKVFSLFHTTLLGGRRTESKDLLPFRLRIFTAIVLPPNHFHPSSYFSFNGVNELLVFWTNKFM